MSLQVSSVKVRHFRILDSDDRSFRHRLQDLRQGNQFRSTDDSPYSVWLATSDPYVNAQGVWVIDASPLS